MTEAPAPMTPPDCDLRDYPWMPIDCTRLLTSETWLLGTSDQKVAAITLWMKSWHQVPAGSLPAHDKMLAALSEAGAAWNKVKQHVMRGWVLCSDGRLYHPVVCEKAIESWERKSAQKARTEKARQVKAAKHAGAPTDDDGAPVAASVTSPVTDSEITNVRPSISVSKDENFGERSVMHDGEMKAEQNGASAQNDVISGHEVENTRIGCSVTESVATSVTEPVTASTVPDQTRKDKERDLESFPLPREEAAMAAAESEPRILPTSGLAVVGSLTAHLQGRARGQPFLTPKPNPRTVDEQLARIAPKTSRAAPLTPEQLAAVRAQTRRRIA